MLVDCVYYAAQLPYANWLWSNKHNKWHPADIAKEHSFSAHLFTNETLKHPHYNKMADECRICKDTNNEPENPLISPCSCAGSIGKVHRNCLEEWVRSSAGNNCTVCNTPFAQRTEYSGPLPETLIGVLTKRGKMFNTLQGIAVLLFTTGVLSRAVFGTFWNYFIMSQLTTTKVALYQLFSFGVFAAIGFLVGFARHLNVRVGGAQVQFDFTNLRVPITNICVILDFAVARHHMSFTGNTFPVILLYYISLYNLLSTIIFDILGWYQRQYFKRIFINIFE